MIAVWVALAGSLGAVVRFVVDSALRARSGSSLPWPTVLINVTGSLLLGILAGAVLFHDAPTAMLTIAGVGFCGGYTTFSTTSVDSVRLIVARRYAAAAAIAFGTLATTLVAAAAGLALAAVW
ncbi:MULTISPECIES: fluoride efflux transporter FluC [Rhodococcus]|uniref:fluoride efflux transporter FluC n=1 Tax=Rhodococcus TaxID=1827 RepID=UPI00132F0BE5|nr:MULTISPECIES: CrcB family protein [Rhodococcus]QHG82148.1 CrcB family protein [Rhodococcus rhodochrous]QOH58178.1 fluoride efflux transporter CrcB [Rhodococcus rhodochrous]WAL45791.1 CrcB family protein [Rhodococcus pyridinivorans]